MIQWRTLDTNLIFDVGSVAIAWLQRWLGQKKREQIRDVVYALKF